MLIDRQQLLQRFLRYVQVATQADPAATTYPSSAGQLQLGEQLAAELTAMGLADVEHDSQGLVWATLPSNVAYPRAHGRLQRAPGYVPRGTRGRRPASGHRTLCRRRYRPASGSQQDHSCR